MRNSFSIQSSGLPGTVAAKLVAMSDSGALVELLGKDPQHIENGGGHPWSIAEHTNSNLFLFNSSMETIACDINIGRGANTWHNSYKLRPNETRYVSINDVITQRLPDEKGHQLLGSETQGEVSWFATKRGVVVGRMLQSNSFTLEARSFSCGYNIILCGLLDVQALLFPFEDYGGGGPITPQMCLAYDPNACYGDQYNNGCSSCAYSWRSDDTLIATVSGSNTDPGVTMYGQQGGQTTATAAVMMMGCSGSRRPPIYVQLPWSVSPIATDQNTAAYCVTTATTGWYRHVTNQIYDQFNFPYKKAGTVNDQILISSPNDLGFAGGFTGTGGSDANGTFPDSYSTCSTACPGSTGHTVADQFWFFNGVQVRSITLVDYRCTSIVINGR